VNNIETLACVTHIIDPRRGLVASDRRASDPKNPREPAAMGLSCTTFVATSTSRAPLETAARVTVRELIGKYGGRRLEGP